MPTATLGDRVSPFVLLSRRRLVCFVVLSLRQAARRGGKWEPSSVGRGGRSLTGINHPGFPSPGRRSEEGGVFSMKASCSADGGGGAGRKLAPHSVYTVFIAAAAVARRGGD